MSDLKASISKSMWNMLTITVVPKSQGLVSSRTSLIISNSLPSPPPGAVIPKNYKLCTHDSTILTYLEQHFWQSASHFHPYWQLC